MNNLKVLASGIIKNNPTFVLVLGMCPTLGTTTSAENGFGMGVATMAVLILSNLVISLIKNLIPDKVRIPAFIVVIASFVTIISMLMQAYVPALYSSLGVFIPRRWWGLSAKCWAAGPSSVIRSVLRTTCRWCSCWLRVLLSYWGI